MDKKVVAVFTALLMLVAAAGYPVGLVGTASAGHGGDTVIVDPRGNGHNTTIQGAVNHANPGDNIWVRNGTYSEAVVVNKSVTIFTNESVVMDGRGLDDPAFNITNTTSVGNLDDVVISGFPAIENYSTGIAVTHVGTGMANIVLENNTIENVSDTGILLSYASGTYNNVTVANNTVQSPQTFSAGIVVATFGGVTGNDTVLFRNELNESNADAGILVRTQGATSSLENTTILENNASTTGVGLHLDLRDTSAISDLNVSRNGFGETSQTGLLIEASAAGTVANLTDVNLFENALNNSAGTGLNVSAAETLNVTNLNVASNDVSLNAKAIDINVSASSTLDNVDIVGNALNDSTASLVATGFRLRTHADAAVTDLRLTENVIDNGSSGVVVILQERSTVTQLQVNDTSLTANEEHGILLWATDEATLTNADILDNAINGTVGGVGTTPPEAGVTLFTRGNGTITDVLVNNNNVSDNPIGMQVLAEADGSVSSLNVSSNLLQRSGVAGVLLKSGQPDGAAPNGSIADVTIEENAINDSASGTGVEVEAWGTSNVSDVLVTDSNLSRNDIGIDVYPGNDSTIEALNVSGNFVAHSGQTAISLRAGVSSPVGEATLRNVTVQGNALNETTTGLEIGAEGTGTVTEVNVTENDLRNNMVAIDVAPGGESTVSAVNVTNNLFNGSTAAAGSAVLLRPNGSATVADVTLFQNALDDNAATGEPAVLVNATESATVSDLLVQENALNDNAVGLRFEAHDTASVTGVNVTTNLVNGSSGDAVQLHADGDSSITAVDIVTNGLNETPTGVGVDVDTAGNATVGPLNVTENSFANTTVGIRAVVAGNSTLTDLNVTNNLLNGSSQHGLHLTADGTVARITDVHVFENLLNDTATGTAPLRIEAAGDANVSGVLVQTNALDNNSAGLRVVAHNASTVHGLNVTNNLLEGNADVGVHLVARSDAGSTATFEDVDIVENALNETSSGPGLRIDAFDASAVTDVRVATNDLRNNTVGVLVSAPENATVSGLDITEALASGSAQSAMQLVAGTPGTNSAAAITNVTVTEAGLNDTVSGPGVLVAAYDSSAVTDLRFDTVSFANNTRGLLVNAANGSLVDGVNVTSALFKNNSDDGATLFTGAAGTGSSSTIANVSFDTVGLNETGGTGLAVQATGTSTVSGLDIDTASLANNTGWGLTLQAVESGTVRDVNVSTALFSGNANGAAVVAGRPASTDTATVTNVSFTEVGLNETAGNGLLVGAQADSTVTDVNVQTADLSDNTIGLRVAARDGGAVSGVSVDEALVNASSTHGILLEASDSASLSTVNVSNVAVNFTATGAGIEVNASGSASIAEVTLFRAITKGNPVGQRYVAIDGATISTVNITNTLNTENARSGLAIEAGEAGTTDTASVTGVNVTVNAFNDTTSGPGLNVSTWGSAEVSDVLVFQNALAGNRHGLHVGAMGSSTIADVNVTQALIADNARNGFVVDGGTGAHDNVRIRLSLIENSGVAGVNVSAGADVTGVSVHRTFISGNAVGVDNNADATFDARFNWWGDSSGAGSVSDADAPFEDPVTGKLANGDGDTVSESPSTAGVSNVRFDPAIGGKTRASEDDQVFNLVGLLTDETFSLTVSGQTISGPISDFVGVNAWERLALPFRADDDAAATKIQNTRIDLRTEEGDIRVAGEGSNRKFIKVFDQDRQLNLDYLKVSPGADTTRFAGDEVRLIVARLNQSANVSSNLGAMFQTDIDTDSGQATLATNLTVVEAFDLGTLDGNGEIRDVPYTPSEPGTYLFLLTTVNSGDGLDVTASGNLTFNVLNDSVTLIGAEVATVHTSASNASPRSDTARPGDTVIFDADSNLASSNVTHAVLIYDKQAFEEELVVLNATNATVTLNNTTVVATVTGSVSGDPFLIRVNASTDGTLNNVTVTGGTSNVTAAIGITRFGSSSDTVLVDVPTNVVFGDKKNKTFNWVHLAVAENDVTKRSTTDAKGDVIQVVKPGEDLPNIDASPTSLDYGSVRVGNAKTLDVTISNTGNATLNITSTAIVGTDPGQFSIVSGGGADLLAPGASKTISVRFKPSLTGAKSASLRIRSNDTVEPTLDVPLSGTGESAPAPGPPRRPAPPEEEEAEVNVTPTAANESVVNVTNVGPGINVTITLPANFGANGANFTSIRVTMAGDATVDSFDLRLRHAARAPSGTPAFALTGDVPRYLVVTPTGVTDDQLASVEFRFRVDADRLDPGEPPTNVDLNRFEAGDWRQLPTAFVGRTGGNLSYSATSPGFSAFAVSNADPSFEIVSTDLSPQTVAPGEAATVTVTVENQGDGDGVFTAELTAEGDRIATRNVSIPAGESRTIEFDVAFDEPGDYALAVNDVEVGTLTVEEVTPTPETPTPETPTPETPTPETPTPPPETPTPPERPFPTGLAVAILILLVILAGAVYYYREELRDRFGP